MVFRITVASECAVAVDTPTAALLLEHIETHVKHGQGFAVATLNMDHIHKLRHSPEFRTAYLRQTHVVADGNPIVWLSRLAGTPVRLAPGSELIEPIAALAARLDAPVALLGSTQAALDKAAAALTTRYPSLRIVARIAPPFGFDVGGAAGAECLAAVRASGARLCFLALGAPKQESLAARGLDLVPGCGFLSIGAGIDFLAGHQRRAPHWVRAIAMEWFWRMAGDPRRLAGRYARGFAILPGLMAQVLGRRLSRHAGTRAAPVPGNLAPPHPAE